MDVETKQEPMLTEEQHQILPGTIKQRVNADIALKRILLSIIGNAERNFQDGLLYDSTIKALHNLWNKMDYVHHGILQQRDFENARGVDPIWTEILQACDFNCDGNITPAEFVAGFVMAALDKELSVSIPALISSKVTGLRVMTNVVDMLNGQVMDEIFVVYHKMGWRA